MQHYEIYYKLRNLWDPPYYSLCYEMKLYDKIAAISPRTFGHWDQFFSYSKDFVRYAVCATHKIEVIINNYANKKRKKRGCKHST